MSDISFAALGVSADVVRALSARGIDTPFHFQTRTIPEAMRGSDVLVKSPTGSGKTLAFAIPIVENLDRGAKRPSALVLVPTRELAVQVTDDLQALSPARDLKVASVYGGVPLRAQADRARSAHVLVATPGRLQDLVDRRLVSLDAITVLVLDEADRMLDMGFKPQVDKIVRRLPTERQTMFFSATLDGEVGELAHLYTTSPARIEAQLPSGQSPARSTITSSPSRPTPRSRSSSSSSTPSGASYSSSYGRSAEPTASHRSSRGTACAPPRCTATRASHSASARSRASRTGR